MIQEILEFVIHILINIKPLIKIKLISPNNREIEPSPTNTGRVKLQEAIDTIQGKQSAGIIVDVIKCLKRVLAGVTSSIESNQWSIPSLSE